MASAAKNKHVLPYASVGPYTLTLYVIGLEHI